jgi:hypothetical protein
LHALERTAIASRLGSIYPANQQLRALDETSTQDSGRCGRNIWYKHHPQIGQQADCKIFAVASVLHQMEIGRQGNYHDRCDRKPNLDTSLNFVASLRFPLEAWMDQAI